MATREDELDKIVDDWWREQGLRERGPMLGELKEKLHAAGYRRLEELEEEKVLGFINSFNYLDALSIDKKHDVVKALCSRFGRSPISEEKIKEAI